MANLQRKAKAADAMFSRLVSCMNEAERIEYVDHYTKKEEFPKWLAANN